MGSPQDFYTIKKTVTKLIKNMVHLVYFPIAGRGELSRLIAKVGGIDDFSESTEVPDGINAAECGSPGSIPLLIDGDDLKMNESCAIEIYLASIAPKFASLTAKQRAKDHQFCMLKETCMGAIGEALFTDKKDKEGITAVVDKFFPLLEGILPSSGFVNGLADPTVADLTIVVLCEAYMPFGASYKYGEIDLAEKYPKLLAHSNRTKAVESVGNAISESSTMKAAAFEM